MTLDSRAMALFHRYRSPAVLLHRPFPAHSAPASNSYFGGLPALPPGLDWPRTSTDVPLHFLCQVDCADIAWDTPLPDRGILFFFGRDDLEQIWGQGPREDDCRVLYAPDASGYCNVADPPADLPTIGWPDRRFRQVAPEGEPDRRVHVKWPVEPLPLDTFPDQSGLPPSVADYNRTARHWRFEYAVRKRLRSLLPWIRRFPQWVRVSSEQPVWDRYDELLPAVRARAFAAATGLVLKEQISLPARSQAVRRMFADETFPQYWIFIHFFALVALDRWRGSGLGPESAEEIAAREEADARLDTQAREWLHRSRAVPLERPVADAERDEFRSWAGHIHFRADHPSPGYRCIDWLRDSATWAIRSWAGQRERSATIPPGVYEALEDVFRTNHVQHGEEKDWHTLNYSQMLGQAPASQDAAPADGPDVCLLNLASDPGLGWTFGDAGECTFWISREDLELRDFSRVRGSIEGH